MTKAIPTTKAPPFLKMKQIFLRPQAVPRAPAPSHSAGVFYECKSDC